MGIRPNQLEIFTTSLVNGLSEDFQDPGILLQMSAVSILPPTANFFLFLVQRS